MSHKPSSVDAMETPERYAKGLTDAETLPALRDHVAAYAELAKDALPIVQAMTDADFVVWRKGLRSERRGRFAGVEFAQRFAAVMMPEPMFTVARLATTYCAPFNVTLRRIKEVRPELLDPDPDRTRRERLKESGDVA